MLVFDVLFSQPSATVCQGVVTAHCGKRRVTSLKNRHTPFETILSAAAGMMLVYI